MVRGTIQEEEEEEEGDDYDNGHGNIIASLKHHFTRRKVCEETRSWDFMSLNKECPAIFFLV
jgi:hypothetical protein